jgi:hypothetical protein
MIDPTGAVEIQFGGKTYAMRLTMRGIARLQAKHGRTLAGLLDGTQGDFPDMGVVLDLVSEALQRGEGLDAAAADDLADEIATADASVVGRIMASAFPDAEGNAQRKMAAGG